VVDEEDSRELTSIGDNGESPNKTGEDGRKRIGIVRGEASLFGGGGRGDGDEH
jgi:hypothetical protein